MVQRNTIDVKFGLFNLAFLLCSGLGYSQTYKLQHLETNNYKVKTVHLNENNLCTVIYKNYDELEKDERGWVRAIVLDLRGDTLSIIEADSTQQKTRTPFNAGKRTWTMPIISVYRQSNMKENKKE